MRPPKPKDLIHPEISLLPLIDIYLVLMIVLLVVGPMVRAGSAKPAQPGTREKVTGTAAPSGVFSLDEPQLAVSIESDGSLYVDGRHVKQADLQKVLGEIRLLTPNRPVMVKGDRRVRYEQVRWVLQSVNAAGFRRAGLTVDARVTRKR
jgi:biopolymer transport protein ExbD